MLPPISRAVQSAETPADVVPDDVSIPLGDFFREKDVAAVAAFAGNLVDALFRGVPDSASSKEVPAKTKVMSVSTLCMTPARRSPCIPQWFVFAWLPSTNRINKLAVHSCLSYM